MGWMEMFILTWSRIGIYFGDQGSIRDHGCALMWPNMQSGWKFWMAICSLCIWGDRKREHLISSNNSFWIFFPQSDIASLPGCVGTILQISEEADHLAKEGVLKPHLICTNSNSCNVILVIWYCKVVANDLSYISAWKLYTKKVCSYHFSSWIYENAPNLWCFKIFRFVKNKSASSSAYCWVGPLCMLLPPVL